MDAFLESILGAQLGKTLAQRGPSPGKPVHLTASVSRDTVIAGAATLSDAGTLGNISFCLSVHDYDLSCSEQLHCVVFRSSAFYQHSETVPHPYRFITPDYVPKTLGNLLSSGWYA